MTIKGIEYLDENSMMKKAYKTLKELKDWIPGT
ncbi:YjcQ family protein [Lactococcus lactis]|nr:YjcQ family protein [Lactococcus lactis]